MVVPGDGAAVTGSQCQAGRLLGLEVQLLVQKGLQVHRLGTTPSLLSRAGGPRWWSSAWALSESVVLLEGHPPTELAQPWAPGPCSSPQAETARHTGRAWLTFREFAREAQTAAGPSCGCTRDLARPEMGGSGAGWLQHLHIRSFL